MWTDGLCGRHSPPTGCGFFRRTLLHPDPAPVDDETLIGDAGAVFCGKEQDKASNLCGPDDPLQRLSCKDFGFVRFCNQSRSCRSV
jgi:hypothetical protein